MMRCGCGTERELQWLCDDCGDCIDVEPGSIAADRDDWKARAERAEAELRDNYVRRDVWDAEQDRAEWLRLEVLRLEAQLALAMHWGRELAVWYSLAQDAARELDEQLRYTVRARLERDALRAEVERLRDRVEERQASELRMMKQRDQAMMACDGRQRQIEDLAHENERLRAVAEAFRKAELCGLCDVAMGAALAALESEGRLERSDMDAEGGGDGR